MISDLKFRHWFGYKNGKLIFDNPNLYQINLDYYEGKRGYICFYDEDEALPVPTGSRNYYFKIIIGALSNHKDFYGMSPIEIHHDLMQFFYGTWRINSDGKYEIWYPPMSDMTAKNWREHIEKVTYFAEEKGIILTPVNLYQAGKSPDFNDNVL